MPISRQFVRLAAVSGLVALARGGLVCEMPAFDFGLRPDTDRGLSHTFEIRNDGAEPVVIVEIRPTCDCLTADMARRTLRPGDRAPVDVHFDFGKLAGGQHRVIHVAFRPEEDPSAPLQVISLALRGSIVTPVLREPDTIDLGTLLPGGVATGTVRLISGRAGPFALRAVGLTDASGRADYTAGRTATNHVVRLRVPAPDRSGPFAGMALAETDLEGMPPVAIAYRGRVAPMIEAVPPVFGIARGAPVDARVSLVSAHRAAFAPLSAQATDPRLSTILTREGKVFQIRVTSTVPGREFADALVRVTTDHPLGRIIEIPIRFIDSQ